MLTLGPHYKSRLALMAIRLRFTPPRHTSRRLSSHNPEGRGLEADNTSFLPAHALVSCPQTYSIGLQGRMEYQ